MAARGSTSAGTAALVVLVLAAGGCREGDLPAEGAFDERMYITSDPTAGSIIINSEDTGLRTPDTLRLPPGDYGIEIRRDTAGYTYRLGGVLRVIPTDEVISLHVALGIQCPLDEPEACSADALQYHDVAGMRFATAANGSLFFEDGSDGGAYWPASGANSYVSAGMPVVAADLNTGPAALGPYDQHFLAGRPAPSLNMADGMLRLTQHTWLVPPPHPDIGTGTVRGLEVQQEVIASDAVQGVVVVRLTFRNVSDEPIYYALARHVPMQPVTYTNAYIGFALDPDIGSPSDDWLSYDADLQIAFAYDADFSEPGFGDAAAAPSLVGLRALSTPVGTAVVLNGWANTPDATGDWGAGTFDEVNGYRMLTGLDPYDPVHADPRIGHLPPEAGDVRVTVTAGPVDIEPGEEAEIVVAFAIAPPTPGTFDSGSIVVPGEPLDETRALYAIAQLLRERLVAAGSLLGELAAHR